MNRPKKVTPKLNYTLSESLEVMLVLGGIYLLAASTFSLFRAIAAGVLLGLAYLTRPEALAIVLGLVAWMLILWVRKEKRFFLFAAALAVMFLTVAPYWLWFHAQTGSWSFSGKSSVIKLGLLREETTQDIEWRLLNDTQTEIQVPDPDFSPGHLLAHYARNVWRLKERIIANAGIEPLAGFLLVWGLLCMVTFIFRRHAWGIGAFQLVLFAPFFVFPLFWVEDRFVYQISPVLALWIALGLVELHRWLLQGWQEYKTIDRFLSTGVVGILLAAILASFVFRLATTNVNANQIQAAQEAAELLRRFAPDGNVGVISEYPAIAYFADTRGEFTPNANLDALRTFATAKRSQFIVIGNTDARTEATKQLLDGDFAPAVAKRLGEVKRDDLNLVLFYLYPREP